MNTEPMNQRLRQSRAMAGFKTARAAIREFGWPESTVYCHEGGNRGITKSAAEIYADAYNVSLEWLWLGTGNPSPQQRTVLVNTFDALSPARRKMLLDTAAMFLAHQGLDPSPEE